MMRESIMQTYNELNALRTVRKGLQIHFEYVSKYRRVIVVSDATGYILKVSYKGLPVRLGSWEKRYAQKKDAVGWAEVQVANRDIVVSGILTMVDFSGKRII